MSTPTQVVQDFVDAFIAGWPTGDAAGVASFFSSDAVYVYGPLEPVHGQEAIQATIAEFMAMGGEVSVDMRYLLAGGDVVMTERIDHFTVGGKTFSLPLMGIFEIEDAKITAWRDYFDLSQFSSLLASGG